MNAGDFLATSAGMIFVYDAPTHPQFWMRNTLIPLDMIFADAKGRVTRVHSNAIPHDETPIDGGQGVRFKVGGLPVPARQPSGKPHRVLPGARGNLQRPATGRQQGLQHFQNRVLVAFGRGAVVRLAQETFAGLG